MFFIVFSSSWSFGFNVPNSPSKVNQNVDKNNGFTHQEVGRYSKLLGALTWANYPPFYPVTPLHPLIISESFPWRMPRCLLGILPFLWKHDKFQSLWILWILYLYNFQIIWRVWLRKNFPTFRDSLLLLQCSRDQREFIFSLNEKILFKFWYNIIKLHVFVMCTTAGVSELLSTNDDFLPLMIEPRLYT